MCIYIDDMIQMKCGESACVGTTANLNGDLMNINCDFIDSCSHSSFDATGINAVGCSGNSSCESSTLHLEFDETSHGGIECGHKGCRYTTMNIKNSWFVDCSGIESCFESTIEVLVTDKEFVFQCGSSYACTNTNIVITVAPEIKYFKGIECEDLLSCQDAVFTIKAPNHNAAMETLECDGPEACLNTRFTLINVAIGNEECFGPDACKGMTINKVYTNK